MDKFKVGDRIGKLEVLDIYLIKGKRTTLKYRMQHGIMSFEKKKEEI